MKLKMQLRSLAFIYNLINNNIHCSFPSEKPLFDSSEQAGTFPEVLPEQEGVHSSGLLNMFATLSADRHVNPHAAVVIRNGKIIAEASWDPFSASLPHVSHSLAKSVTSMAIGIAVKEKYISVDERLGDIFGTNEKPVRDVTIHELLTMSSGVKFNEAGSLMSNNWVESFLSSDVFFEHGTEFNYNSMNSYMLSAILCKRTGLSLSEYISSHLFSPMGINNFYWEKCPSGIEKGGWGLYLSTYDYAKLGQMWLEKGIWNGRQLVPKEWVTKASLPHINTKNLCSRGYGYQVWLGKHGSIFSGMFGQLVYIVPKRNMVIALTAGSENLFPCGNALKCIDSFFDKAENFSTENFSRTPFTPFQYSSTAALRKALSSAKFSTPLAASRNNIFSRLKELLPKENTSPQKVLDGIGIEFNNNNAHLLPLLIQVMDGCFGQGIKRINFSANELLLHMQIIFKDSSVTIPISFGKNEHFTYKGYVVASQAFFTTDEDDLPVLKVQFCFIETSCTKILKFIFNDEGVTLKVRESPQLYNALDEVSLLAASQLGTGLQRTLEAVLETDIADYKIKNFIEPTIEGYYRLSTKFNK